MYAPPDPFKCVEVTMSDQEDLCDEAMDLYKKALEIDPKFGDAAQGLALCYKAKGDLDTAIAVTNEYIKHEPEDILAFTNLSMFYQQKGMIKEAEAAGAEARRLDWKRQLKEAKPKS